MSNKSRDISTPFFLDGRRAMVSLGPLAPGAYCPYKCAFCYVQDEFMSYAQLELQQIVNFLIANREKYNIIYISGDTDSFAPPRTRKAVDLLKMITENVHCDITFSTRSVFSDEIYNELGQIIENHKKSGYLFIAGSSITRYSDKTAYLEPPPIPTPDERIQHIIKMKQLGAVTMLGLRPFLPVVDKEDYITILDKLYPFLDIALGECFYFIRDGHIQKHVFPNGINSDTEKDIIKNQKMYFDDNGALWDVWNSIEYEVFVRNHCQKRGIIFSMHSSDALEEYKKDEKRN